MSLQIRLPLGSGNWGWNEKKTPALDQDNVEVQNYTTVLDIQIKKKFWEEPVTYFSLI